MVIHTYFCTNGYENVKRFVRVLVLLVINTGCPKKCKDLMNEGRFPHVGDSICFCLPRLPLLAGNSPLGPVHMIPGQLIASGQLTDPGVNFTSVHGLTSVTVHINFSLPRGNFERRVTRCTTPCNRPCQGNFSPCEQNTKVALGQE